MLSYAFSFKNVYQNHSKNRNGLGYISIEVVKSSIFHLKNGSCSFVEVGRIDTSMSDETEPETEIKN